MSLESTHYSTIGIITAAFVIIKLVSVGMFCARERELRSEEDIVVNHAHPVGCLSRLNLRRTHFDDLSMDKSGGILTVRRRESLSKGLPVLKKHRYRKFTRFNVLRKKEKLYVELLSRIKLQSLSVLLTVYPRQSVAVRAR